jgi:hypothetical protein
VKVSIKQNLKFEFAVFFARFSRPYGANEYYKEGGEQNVCA